MRALPRLDLHSEQGLLQLSVAVTVLLSLLGTLAGLLAGSLAIVFDSLYEMLDAVMTLLALLVSRLVTAAAAGRLRPWLARRFTMGMWHLEPLVVALNGTLLVCAAGYALMLSVDSLRAGGREVQAGLALGYASAFLVVQLGMACLIARRNRRIGSALLAIDVQSWLMAAATSLALLPAFGVGLLVRGSEWAWITPYIDPAVLGLICILILPLPLGALRQALGEILLMAPAGLQGHVDGVARQTVTRHGLLAHASQVARVGRETQVELIFLVPADMPAHGIAYWDAIRADIAEALGPDPHRWLCISFTARPEWMPHKLD